MSLLNRAAVKAQVLTRLVELRPALTGKLTRVSAESYRFLERRLASIIDDSLRTHSTVGKTINLERH